MIDIDKAALFSANSSLKVIDTIPGTITSPITSTLAETIVEIPHGQDSTDLIPQVVANAPLYGITQYFTLPYEASDGREALDVYFDAGYVYIKATSRSGGLPTDGVQYNYYLTILIP